MSHEPQQKYRTLGVAVDILCLLREMLRCDYVKLYAYMKKEGNDSALIWQAERCEMKPFRDRRYGVRVRIGQAEERYEGEIM